MNSQVPPMWKMRVNDCLKRSNKVNLSGENIDDLEKLGTLKLMVQLDLSYVRTIQSFEGLKPQPSLKALIADGSTIASLKNILAISKITTISLKSTPLSKSTPSFNLVASLLLVLPNLNIFNGKLISQNTREKVKSAGYPMPETEQLINAGWIVEYPCPPKNEIIELLKYYGIYSEDEHKLEYETDNEEEQQVRNNEFEEEEEEANDEIENDVNEDSHANSYRSQNVVSNNIPENTENHTNQNIKDENSEEIDQYEQDDQNENNNYPARSDDDGYNEYENTKDNANDYDENYDNNDNLDNKRSTKNLSELSLLDKVAIVLRNNGYQVDPNNKQQSVLNIIDSLCSEMEQINSTLPLSEQSSQF